LTPTVTGRILSYVVSPALPTGLNVNPKTGVISGTPDVVAAKASYTVTALNAGGSASAKVSITIIGVAPSIAYSSPYYAYTAGLPAQTTTPTATGSTVVTWSVSPALPAGLVLGATDGSISGKPTAAAAPAKAETAKAKTEAPADAAPKA